MKTAIFEDFGLTNTEIKTYLEVLKKGTLTAREIIMETKLQNSVVYRALDKLIGRGLIGYILNGKRKIYQSKSPEDFLEFINEKKEEYEKLIPEIKELQKQERQKEKATIYKGVRGIKEVYRIMRETRAKEYLTFGGGKACENCFGTTWWLNHHTKRIANRLPARQIYDKTIKEIGKKLIKKPLTKIKFFSKEFAQLQETVIAGNKVAINVFTENPYGFLIEDKIVAEGYKKQFEILWKSAKELKKPISQKKCSNK